MAKMSKELETAISAAKTGAARALTYFNKNLKVKYKKDQTPVTIADKSTEEAMVNYIKSRFPKAKFLCEESGGSITNDDLWIIDPIDGTRSFIRGVPAWCVIVSLSRKKEITQCAIYYPFTKNVYYAEKGEGAYVNGKLIRVSEVADISRAYLGYGSIKHFINKRRLINITSAVGSARSWEVTYSSCLVAEGKMDISVDEYGRAWDIAPFKLLIEEAGGKITRFNGGKWTLEGRGAVITNGILHEKVLRILNNTRIDESA